MTFHPRSLVSAAVAALALTAATMTPLAADAAPATTALSTPACHSAQLSVHLGRSEGAAGTIYQNVRFRNHSSRTCTLRGYPRFRFAYQGHAIGYAATRSQVAHAAVSLPPGQHAVASVGIPEYANFPKARCHAHKTTALRVRAPHTATIHRFAYRDTVCTTKAGRSVSTPVH